MATRGSGLGGVVLASTARTADISVVMSMPRGTKNMMLVMDVTADTGTAAVTPKIRVLDANGDYNAVIWTAAAAVNGTGETSYLFQPGIIAADFNGTEAVSFLPPADFQLFMDAADSESFTYSVQVHYAS